MTRNRFKSLALLPMAVVLMASAAFVMIKTGRDALYFRDYGILQLPAAYISIAVFNIPASLLHMALIRRVGGRVARVIVFIIAVAVFLALALLAGTESPLVLGALFVAVPIIFAAVFAAGWLLAADMLEVGSQDLLAWAYSRISACSMVGGICGGVLSRIVSQSGPPVNLLALGACALLVGLFFVVVAHAMRPIERSDPHFDGEISEDEAPPLVSLFRLPYIRTMGMISVMAALVGVMIDFQFYAAVTVSDNVTPMFFANFYIALNAVSLFFQLMIAPRIQTRFGVGATLLLFPLLLLSGVTGVTIAFVTSARVALKAAEGGLKSALHRGAWEQAFLPIQRGARALAKSLVDGLLVRLAEGAGGVVLLAWLWLVPSPLAPPALRFMFVGTLALLGVWLFATQRLRSLGCSTDGPPETGIRLPDS